MPAIEQKWKSWGERNAFVGFLDAILTGFSQLVLNKNSICGAIIISAVACVAPIQAISAIWTACVALLIIYALGIPREPVRLGLYTINPVLAGMALPMVIYKNSFEALPQLLIYGIVAAVLTTIFTAALRRILGIFQASPLALPFCVTIMVLSSSTSLLTAMNADPLFTPAVMALQKGNNTAWTLGDFVIAVLNGIAETIWIEDIPRTEIIGIAVLVGIFVASRIAALITVVFATAATSVAILLGLRHGGILIGLYGYNAVLIGLLFFGHAFRMSIGSFLLSFTLAIVSVVFVAGLKPLMSVIGAPVAVFPFVIMAISVMVGRKFFTSLSYIAPENWTTPERSGQAPVAEFPKI